MGEQIKPGNLKEKPDNYTQFTNSMASAIEEELNTLMILDNVPELNMDVNDDSVRDRRRLFVAIARGVVRHLEENKEAIKIALPEAIELPTNVSPNAIQTTGL